MAIKRGLKGRLAEIGKIKIGGKGETRKGKNGDWQLPVKYGFFKVVKTERGPDGNFIEDDKIMKELGPEPKEIPIRLLFESIDMNFHTSFSFYHGARCRCSGNGETAEMLFLKDGTPENFTLLTETGKDENGEPKYKPAENQTVKAGELRRIICDTEKCPMMRPDDKGQTKCKPTGILSCIIPILNDIGGVYKFRTHSWNTISNILGSLEFLKSITNGILVGLPLKLVMLKKVSQEHGNIDVVNIVFDGANYEEMRKQALIEAKNRSEYGINIRMIEDQARASGILDDKDDPAEIEAEFYTVKEPEEKKTISERAETVLNSQGAEPEKTLIIGQPEEKTQEPEPEKEQESEEKQDLPPADDKTGLNFW